MIILSQKEIEILLFIHYTKYGYGTHIKDEFFADVSRQVLSKKMRKLESTGLVDSFMIPANLSKLLNKEKVYFLTDKGAKYVAEEMECTVEELGYKKVGNKPVKINHIYHRKQQNNTLIALRKDLEGTNTITKYLFKDYERIKLDTGGFRESTTIWTKDNKYQISPDLTVVLHNQAENKQALFFIEIDCKTETIYGRKDSTKFSSLFNKYETYLKIYEDGNWKNLIDTTAQAFKVLTVTEDYGHIESIREKALIAHHNQDYSFLKYPDIFLFSIHDWVKEHGVFSGRNWLGFEKNSTETGDQSFVTAI